MAVPVAEGLNLVRHTFHCHHSWRAVPTAAPSSISSVAGKKGSPPRKKSAQSPRRRDSKPGLSMTGEYDSQGGDVARAAGGIAHETGDLHRLLVESVQDYA